MIREPEQDETPLSASEVLILERQLMDKNPCQLRARAHLINCSFVNLADILVFDALRLNVHRLEHDL